MGAATSILRTGSLFVLGGGGEGVTRFEFDGGGARVGVATCIGGVVFRAAPIYTYAAAIKQKKLVMRI